MNDYQKSFTTGKSPAEVYAAVTEHIPDWWSNDLEGAASGAGDRFTIGFNRTRKTMEILEAIPGEQVVWKCVKAFIAMDSLKNKAEWEGTRMIWTFRFFGQGTTLHFLHEGLNQGLECYEVCESGWNQFLASLQSFLETGKGAPFLRV